MTFMFFGTFQNASRVPTVRLLSCRTLGNLLREGRRFLQLETTLKLHVRCAWVFRDLVVQSWTLSPPRDQRERFFEKSLANWTSSWMAVWVWGNAEKVLRETPRASAV